MAVNDPLGDMLTRIRNAQMRKRGKVSTPGSSLRAHVLDVLASEGYIRGYSTTDYGNGRSEFEIELKYFDNEPVIRKVERVSKPGRRVYVAVDAMPRVANGLRFDRRLFRDRSDMFEGENSFDIYGLGLVGGDEGRPRAEKGVEHDIAAVGEVEKRILEHGGRLDGRVILQTPAGVGAHRRRAGVGP